MQRFARAAEVLVTGIEPDVDPAASGSSFEYNHFAHGVLATVGAGLMVAGLYYGWEQQQGASRDNGKQSQKRDLRASSLYLTTRERFFSPPGLAVQRCAKAAEEHAVGTRKAHNFQRRPQGFRRESLTVTPVEAPDLPSRWAWIARAAGTPQPVADELWVVYRTWVDENVAGHGHMVFNAFAVARALGIQTSASTGIWSGACTGDLLVCLATGGMLARGTAAGRPALLRFLEETLYCFNERFRYAQERVYQGLGAAEQSGWDGAYDFIQLADPQLGMLRMDQDWAEEVTMLRLAVQHVNRLKPRFLLVSGDLTNVWPSRETASVVAAQAQSFKEALRDLDPTIPLVLQPGNHDVGQDPRREDVERYKQNFGDDYFSFWVGGVLYVAVNSQYYHKLCVNKEAAQLRRAQEEWLEGVLTPEECTRARHVVMLTHVAPFMGKEDESHGHFNWSVEGRRWLLDLAERARIKLILCGHYHGNCVVRSEGGVEVVTTSSCGGMINWKLPPAELAPAETFNFMECVGSPPVVCDSYSSGMRIVRVGEQAIRHRFFELASVPKVLDEAFDDSLASSHVERPFPMRGPALEQIMGLPSSVQTTMKTMAFASKLKKRATSGSGRDAMQMRAASIGSPGRSSDAVGER